VLSDAENRASTYKVQLGYWEQRIDIGYTGLGQQYLESHVWRRRRMGPWLNDGEWRWPDSCKRRALKWSLIS
jgi:hypothetical protein